MKISFYSYKLKMAKKWQNFIKRSNVFFDGQRTSKMAKFFEI